MEESQICVEKFEPLKQIFNRFFEENKEVGAG